MFDQTTAAQAAERDLGAIINCGLAAADTSTPGDGPPCTGKVAYTRESGAGPDGTGVESGDGARGGDVGSG